MGAEYFGAMELRGDAGEKFAGWPRDVSSVDLSRSIAPLSAENPSRRVVVSAKRGCRKSLFALRRKSSFENASSKGMLSDRSSEPFSLRISSESRDSLSIVALHDRRWCSASCCFRRSSIGATALC